MKSSKKKHVSFQNSINKMFLSFLLVHYNFVEFLMLFYPL